jgi:hypothetical protein
MCRWVLADRQEEECWNGLRGLHPLPYHMGFMVRLASRVSPSVIVGKLELDMTYTGHMLELKRQRGLSTFAVQNPRTFAVQK